MAMAYADTAAVQGLCGLYLRPLDHWTDHGDGRADPVFVPPLTTAEQADYADLVVMARFGVSMTLAEWQAVKADAAALKAIIHVLSVIVRD